MKDVFRDLCSRLAHAWDEGGDVGAIVDRIKINLAVTPPLAKKPTRGQAKVPPLPPLPVFAAPHREHLEMWWENRCRKHKTADFKLLSKKTLDALALAEKLGVLAEFCEQASERDWMSLGFAGYTEHLQRLAKDKSFAASGGVNNVQSRLIPRPPVDMEKHPSYRPLAVEETEANEEQFF